MMTIVANSQLLPRHWMQMGLTELQSLQKQLEEDRIYWQGYRQGLKQKGVADTDREFMACAATIAEHITAINLIKGLICARLQ